jgi:hypothetical protein
VSINSNKKRILNISYSNDEMFGDQLLAQPVLETIRVINKKTKYGILYEFIKNKLTLKKLL